MPQIDHEQHRLRHVALHEALDELVADWLEHTGGQATHVGDLIRWSREQTQDPEGTDHNIPL